MIWEWHMIEEEKAMRALRKVVEGTAAKLRDAEMDEVEAARIVALTRNWVFKVFPERLGAFDSIYRPRLESIYRKSHEGQAR